MLVISTHEGAIMFFLCNVICFPCRIWKTELVTHGRKKRKRQKQKQNKTTTTNKQEQKSLLWLSDRFHSQIKLFSHDWTFAGSLCTKPLLDLWVMTIYGNLQKCKSFIRLWDNLHYIYIYLIWTTLRQSQWTDQYQSGSLSLEPAYHLFYSSSPTQFSLPSTVCMTYMISI